jgi:hypothetical protein
VHQDSSEQAGAVPAQRTGAPAPQPRPPEPDETVILPAFITGKKERPPKPPEPVRHGAQPTDPLPASERGMLIFVAALLGVGTVAIVALLGLGGFSRPHPVATHPPSVAATLPAPGSPSPVASSVAPSPTPPSPSPSVAPTTPPVRHSTGPVALGTLTTGDPAAFCIYSKAGRARQRDDGSWFCSGSRDHGAFAFAPTDVCRWRYLDTTAYAVTGDPTDPTTWRCYT